MSDYSTNNRSATPITDWPQEATNVTGGVVLNLANVCTYLEDSNIWKGVFRFNRFTREHMICKLPDGGYISPDAQAVLSAMNDLMLRAMVLLSKKMEERNADGA